MVSLGGTGCRRDYQGIRLIDRDGRKTKLSSGCCSCPNETVVSSRPSRKDTTTSRWSYRRRGVMRMDQNLRKGYKKRLG
jgi:hypothetical protein